MNKRVGLFGFLIVCGLILSACAFSMEDLQGLFESAESTPDIPMLSATLVLDVESHVQPTLTPTLSETEIALTPIIIPTIEITPVLNPEIELAQSPIRISSPVENSVLVSPFLLVVDMEVYSQEKIYLQICDREGTYYVDRWVFSYVYNALRSIDILLDIEYDLGEKLFTPARLSLFVEDKHETRVRGTSIFVNLFADGVSDQFMTTDFTDRIVFTLPSLNGSIKDFGVYVTGYAVTETEKPLTLRLYNLETGEMMSEIESPVFHDGISEHGLFVGYLPYDVKVKTKVLIIVEETSDEFAGVVHISSMPVTLYPIIDPTATPEK